MLSKFFALYQALLKILADTIWVLQSALCYSGHVLQKMDNAIYYAPVVQEMDNCIFAPNGGYRSNHSFENWGISVRYSPGLGEPYSVT